MLNIGKKAKAPKSASYKRIENQYKNLMREPLEGVSAGPIDEEDMYKWQGYIWGPDDSPYEGGVFFFDMEIPSDYPFSPPK